MTDALARIRVQPYKGLVPYSEEDADFFFGREPETEIVIANLIASRLTVLYGESGVGKSSVLRAGVMHHLRQDLERNITAGRPAEFALAILSSWRDNPVVGLACCLQEALSEAQVEGQFDGIDSSLSLCDRVEALTSKTGVEFLVILDQFEDYLLYHGDEAGADTFAAQLPCLINRTRARINFLIAIREDALARLDTFKGRIPCLFENFLRIEHLSEDAARAAIEGPVARYNAVAEGREGPVRIEPELPNRVLEQVREGRVALVVTSQGVAAASEARKPSPRIETPYLQLVMTRLWDEDIGTGSRMLRCATLERLGGAERIVRTHLDLTMATLTPKEQSVAAAVFHHLVTPSGSKIAHSAADLAEYAGLPAAEVLPVVERLCGSGIRILRPVASHGDIPTMRRYQIFHDVLGTAIAEWRRRHAHATERAAEALRSEQARRNAEAAVRVEERARLAARLHRLRVAVGVISGVALLALVAVAWDARQKARNSERAAVSRELAMAARLNLDSDAELSALLALEAVATAREGHVAPPLEAQNALQRAVQAVQVLDRFNPYPAAVCGLALSPDGLQVAVAGCNGMVSIRASASGRELRRFAGNQADFSPDGKHVATTTAAASVTVFDASSGQVVGRWQGGSGRRLGLELELASRIGSVPEGGPSRLARITAVYTGGPAARAGVQVGDLLARLDDIDASGLAVVTRLLERMPANKEVTVDLVREGKPLSLILELGVPPVAQSIAYGPRGDVLAVADDQGCVEVWDARTSQPVWKSCEHSGKVWKAVFSANGDQLATAGDDGVLRIVNARTGAQQFLLPPTIEGYLGITYAPLAAEHGAVAGIAENHGVLLDATPSPETPAGQAGLKRGDVLLRLGGEAITIESLERAEIPPERSVDIEFLRMGRRETVAVMPSARPVAIYDVAFNGDGQRVASVSARGRVSIWSAKTGVRLKEFLADATGGLSIAWSPDSQELIVGGESGARVVTAGGGREVLVLGGYEDSEVTAVAWSRDGSRIAAGNNNGMASIWSASGTAIWREIVHFLPTESASWSPDDTLIATTGDEGKLRVWDTVSLEAVRSFGGGTAGVARAVWSPEGERLAAVNLDGSVTLWNAKGLETNLARPWDSNPALAAAWSPDGRRLATAGRDGIVRVWSVEDSTKSGPVVFVGHRDRVERLAFFHEGGWLVSLSADGTVRVWDSHNGQELFALGGEPNGPVGDSEGLTAVAAHGSGGLLVTASKDGIATVWKAEDDAGIGVLRTLPAAGVKEVAFNPQGGSLATASVDGSVRLWEVATGSEVATFNGHSGAVSTVAFSADGQRLAAATADGSVIIWDARIEGQDAGIIGLDYSADGRRLATVNATGLGRVMDVASGEVELRFSGPINDSWELAFSPSGDRLAVTGLVEPTIIRDSTSGRRVTTLASFGAKAVAWSPDGQRIVTCEGIVAHVWNARTGQKVMTLEGHADDVWGATWSPDGRFIATAGADHTVALWDAERGGGALEKLKGHTDTIFDVAFSPDGTRLATASRDNSARLWHLREGSEVTLILSSHGNTVFRVAFDGTGRRVATASLDGTVRIYDAATGAELNSFGEHAGGAWSVAFSPDGRYVSTGDSQGRLRTLALDLESLEYQALMRVTRSLSASECGAYLHREACSRTAVAVTHVLKARRLARAGHLEAAEEEVKKARENAEVVAFDIAAEQSKTVTRRVRLAQRLMAENRALSAVRVLEQVSQSVPRHDLALALRGVLYGEAGDHERALALIRRAAAGEREAIETYGELAEFYRDEGKFELALAVLTEAKRRHPEYVRNYGLSGVIYQEDVFDFSSAYMDFEKVIELEPGDPVNYANCAEAALAAGHLERAYELAKRALELREERTSVQRKLTMRFIMVASLILQRRTEDARRELQQFILSYRNAPEFPRTWSYAGTRHCLLERAMGHPERDLLLRMVDVLEGKLEVGALEPVGKWAAS